MSTSHDRAVLNQILNPLMPTGDSGAGQVHLEADKVEHDGYEESLKLEKEGVVLAENGKLKEAMEHFER